MYVAVFLFDISYNVEDILLGFYSSARYLTRVISRPNILLFAGKTLLAKLDKFIEGNGSLVLCVYREEILCKPMAWHASNLTRAVLPVTLPALMVALPGKGKKDGDAAMDLFQGEVASALRPVNDVAHGAIAHVYVPIEQPGPFLGRCEERGGPDVPPVDVDILVANLFH